MEPARLLELQAAAWGLALDGDKRDRLVDFARLLGAYDQANVIGTREPRSILLDHILDSLSCFLFEPLVGAQRVADVGSGGGLPGIPIKIAQPTLKATLVESTGKKVRFLCHAVERLGLLDGVEVLDGRVEEVAHARSRRGAYDVVTARAVARLSVVAEYCVPLLRVGGHVISMKARLQAEELSEGERAVEILGAKFSEVLQVPHLPEVGQKERRLVILEKVRDTPKEYPRKVGVPAKKPLGMV
jgi:16S rRNA (guanine527-N7)-methyltransferase